MGLRDRFNESLAQQRSMQIELDQGSQITNRIITPGTRIAGKVVIRNPKPLSVSQIRITIYGVSNSHIIRKAGRSIQLQYFGRGFFFQEITVLHSGQITLEPTPGGHAYPFTFTVPTGTAPMAQNDANMVNRWKPAPPFLGAQEMHTLPPSMSCSKNSIYGSQQATISYHLDATCVKGAKGSSFSLPEVASSFTFSPVRVERAPDLRMQIAPHGPLALHIPSAGVPGGPIPVFAARTQQMASINELLVLTQLEIRMKATTMIRGRTFGFGGKTTDVRQEWVVASLNNLAISLGPQPVNLADWGIRLASPADAKPSFRSYTVCLGYEIMLKYSFRAGSQDVRGEIPWRAFEMLPAFVQ